MMPGPGFEPGTFGFLRLGGGDSQYPMSPTLHQAEPPRQIKKQFALQ